DVSGELAINDKNWFWLTIFGRRAAGVTEKQAEAGLNVLYLRELEDLGVPKARLQKETLHLEPAGKGISRLRADLRPSLYILMVVVGLVLLVACANIANLLLARCVSRQKEIAVRLAMGAGRGRLIRQLLTESVLLAVIAGLLGIVLAMWIKDGLLAASDWGGRGMTALNPALDLRVLGFTFLLSLLTGLLFGIAPAWRSTRVDLTPALKDSGRGSSAASRSWLSKSLIVAQVAVSLLLLIGAGLLLRTLINLQRIEAGFNQQNLLLFRIDPGLIGYKAERLTTLYKDLSEHIEAVPGVRIATFSRVPLLSQGMSSRSVTLPGVAPPAEGERSPTDNIYVHTVRDNFLEAMQIPLLAGRSFTAHDDTTAPRVAI